MLRPTRSTLRILVPIVFTVLLAIAGAQQPSFDCSRATTWAEHAICDTADLAALDVEIAAAYARLREALPEAASERLRDEQRAWLAERDACEGDGDGPGCLLDALSFRALYLNSQVILDAPPDCDTTLAEDGATFATRYELSTLSLVQALYHWADCRRLRTAAELAAGGAGDEDIAAIEGIREGLGLMVTAWLGFDSLAAGGGTMFGIFAADRNRDSETFLAELAATLTTPDGDGRRSGEQAATSELEELRLRLGVRADFLHGPEFRIIFDENDDTLAHWRDAQANHRAGLELALAQLEGRSEPFAEALLAYLDETLGVRLELLKEIVGGD